MFHAHTVTTYICCRCKTTFISNNKLHQHIHFTHKKFKAKKSVSMILSLKSESKLNYVDAYAADIIKLNAVIIIDESDCSFCN